MSDIPQYEIKDTENIYITYVYVTSGNSCKTTLSLDRKSMIITNIVENCIRQTMT